MLEKILTGPNLVLSSLMIWSGLMLLRNLAANRGVSDEPQAEAPAKQREADSPNRQLEVCILEIEGDLSARMDATIRLLDQLIAEADREIVHLESLLAERQTTS